MVQSVADFFLAGTTGRRGARRKARAAGGGTSLPASCLLPGCPAFRRRRCQVLHPAAPSPGTRHARWRTGADTAAGRPGLLWLCACDTAPRPLAAGRRRIAGAVARAEHPAPSRLASSPDRQPLTHPTGATGTPRWGPAPGRFRRVSVPACPRASYRGSRTGQRPVAGLRPAAWRWRPPRSTPRSPYRQRPKQCSHGTSFRRQTLAIQWPVASGDRGRGDSASAHRSTNAVRPGSGAVGACGQNEEALTLQCARRCPCPSAHPCRLASALHPPFSGIHRPCEPPIRETRCRSAEMRDVASRTPGRGDGCQFLAARIRCNRRRLTGRRHGGRRCRRQRERATRCPVSCQAVKVTTLAARRSARSAVLLCK